jgi:hypothetical protein
VNERIQQLAEQAGYEKDMFGIGHWDMPECHKFVELIVRECAGIAYEYDIPNTTGILPGEFIGNRMKIIFGVEE